MSVNHDNLFSLTVGRPLLPGYIYQFVNYAGSCDHCGADTPVPLLPVLFVGTYEDVFGKYWLFETMFYTFCPGCGKDITSMTTYLGGIKVPTGKENSSESRQ